MAAQERILTLRASLKFESGGEAAVEKFNADQVTLRVQGMTGIETMVYLSLREAERLRGLLELLS